MIMVIVIIDLDMIMKDLDNDDHDDDKLRDIWGILRLICRHYALLIDASNNLHQSAMRHIRINPQLFIIITNNNDPMWNTL